jgi:hypothetical protein
MKELAYGAFRLETNGGVFCAAPTVFHPPSDDNFEVIWRDLVSSEWSESCRISAPQDFRERLSNRAGIKEVKPFRP